VTLFLNFAQKGDSKSYFSLNMFIAVVQIFVAQSAVVCTLLWQCISHLQST